MRLLPQKKHRCILALLLLLCSRAWSQTPPNDVESHGRAAQQYLREQRPDLAMHELDAILALDPNNVQAHGNLGLLLFFSGQYQQASTHLQKALSLEPGLWDLRALLGMCNRRLGAETEGRTDLEAAFPHVQNPRIKSQAGRELLESYSATGDLAKQKAMRTELQTMRQSAEGPEQPSTQTQYIGTAACVKCHETQGRTYVHTAHFNTSKLPPTHLQAAKPLVISPTLSFHMEEKNGGFYQTAIAGTQTERERIDLVIGSGVRGQTFLTWDGDSLYELPISNWTEPPGWINSPGYKDGAADFSRAVHPRCLECHVTYLKPLSTDPNTNRYDKTTLSTGISCEVCHGPGAMNNPAKLSPQSQVEQCARCHNGVDRSASDALEHPDVHGNQVGLLEKSKCFRASPTMTCSTCHNVHAPEQAAATYSTKCLNCHQWQACAASKKLGQAIVKNCIDCHMPVEPTNLIVSKTAGQETRATMRNHWIKIYPSAP